MRPALLALAAAVGLASAAEPAPAGGSADDVRADDVRADDAPEADIGVGLLESADLRAL